MPTPTEPDWTAWHEERARFKKRETEGFWADLRALNDHIIKLQEVCPKDKSGWPHSSALPLLKALQRDYASFLDYARLNMPEGFSDYTELGH